MLFELGILCIWFSFILKQVSVGGIDFVLRPCFLLLSASSSREKKRLHFHVSILCSLTFPVSLIIALALCTPLPSLSSCTSLPLPFSSSSSSSSSFSSSSFVFYPHPSPGCYSIEFLPSSLTLPPSSSFILHSSLLFAFTLSLFPPEPPFDVLHLACVR